MSRSRLLDAALDQACRDIAANENKSGVGGTCVVVLPDSGAVHLGALALAASHHELHNMRNVKILSPAELTKDKAIAGSLRQVTKADLQSLGSTTIYVESNSAIGAWFNAEVAGQAASAKFKAANSAKLQLIVKERHAQKMPESQVHTLIALCGAGLTRFDLAPFIPENTTSCYAYPIDKVLKCQEIFVERATASTGVASAAATVTETAKGDTGAGFSHSNKAQVLHERSDNALIPYAFTYSGKVWKLDKIKKPSAAELKEYYSNLAVELQHFAKDDVASHNNALAKAIRQEVQAAEQGATAGAAPAIAADGAAAGETLISKACSAFGKVASLVLWLLLLAGTAVIAMRAWIALAKSARILAAIITSGAVAPPHDWTAWGSLPDWLLRSLFYPLRWCPAWLVPLVLVLPPWYHYTYGHRVCGICGMEDLVVKQVAIAATTVVAAATAHVFVATMLLRSKFVQQRPATQEGFWRLTIVNVS